MSERKSWHVVTSERDPNAFDVANSDGVLVARPPWCREDDARLIAAAPELLRACKAIAAMAVAWEALTPGDIAEVRGAIAKAEGR